MLNIEKLNKHRKETSEQIDRMLEQYNKVLINRPCSYGKTFLMIEKCKKYLGKKLILEPTYSLVDYLQKYDIGNDTFISTYSSLLHKKVEDFKEIYESLDYIFLDEVHRLGAEKWNEYFNTLIEAFPNAKIIGFSATPTRNDGINVLNTIFENIQIEPLFLSDAIIQDLLPNPQYIASLYAIDDFFDIQLDVVEEYKKIGKKEKSLIIDDLQRKKIEYKNLYNIPNIIQKYVLLHSKYRHNMKFIVFIREVAKIEETKIIVKKWFENAFSHINKEINLYDVHYKKGREENHFAIKEFEKRHSNNTIDIVISVNMFNEGIHLDNITGVILLRNTSSDLIYFQQIGRAINTTGETPLIFDFVNNYKNLSDGYIGLFDIYNDSNKSGKKRDIKTETGEIINIHDEGKEFLDIIQKSIKEKCKIQNQYTEKDIDLLKSFEGKMTLQEMSEKTGFPYRSIHWLCNYYQIPFTRKATLMPKGLEILSEQQRKKVANDLISYNGKLTIEELMKKTGYGKEIIDFFISFYKVPYSKKKQNSDNIDLTNEEKKFIEDNVLMYNMHDIAKALNKKVTDISQFYRETKYLKTPHRKRFSEENKNYIRKYYKEKTIQDFVAELGLSYLTIQSFCKGENLCIKKISDKTEERNLEIISFIQKNPNFTSKEMTEKLKIGKAKFYKICKENHLEYKKIVGKQNTMNKFSEEKKKEIYDKYIPQDSCCGLTALSREYHVGIDTIKKIILEKENEFGKEKSKENIRQQENKKIGNLTKRVADIFINKKEEIINLYKNDTPIQKIGDSIGLSKSSVDKIIEYMIQENMIAKREDTRFSKIDSKKLVEDFKNGGSLLELSLKYGIGTYTIKRKVIKEIGLEEYENYKKIRPRTFTSYAKDSKMCEDIIDLIINLKEQGLSNSEIERRTGIRHQKISEILNELGFGNDISVNICPEIMNVILKFHKEGKTFKQIEGLTGIGYKKIEIALKKLDK